MSWYVPLRGIKILLPIAQLGLRLDARALLRNINSAGGEVLLCGGDDFLEGVVDVEDAVDEGGDDREGLRGRVVLVRELVYGVRMG